MPTFTIRDLVKPDRRVLRADPSRTMTGLYNDLAALRGSGDSAHPAYTLLVAHDKLGAAVAAAYGWA